MARRKQPLSVTTGATSSRNIPNQHYNSPSAEELFRELVVGDNSYPSDSTSTILPPITTPSQVMADRFPSLEDFSPSQSDTPRNGVITTPSVSADDDFLTRERALLGDDAAQFASPNDHPASATAVPNHEDEEDLLGGGSYGNAQIKGEDVKRFESSFPEVEETRNERVAPSSTVTGSDALARSQSSNQADDQEEEPEPIRLWRQRRDADLARRAEVSAKKKEATLAAAARWTDSFYEDYNKNKDKAIAKARREAEEYLGKREDTAAGGTAWERVAKLVDLTAKGGNAAGGDGKEKFRTLLKDLKKDENAPGAKGY